MKKPILFLSYFYLISILISCGARKVDKRQLQEEIKTDTKEVVKTDLTINDNIKIETHTIINDTTKEEIEETILIPIDHNKPAIFGKDTLKNGQLTKRKIKRNKVLKSEVNTNLSNDIKTVDKTTKQSEKTQQVKKNESTKNTHREQFSITELAIDLWWLWVLLFLIWYFRKKINIFV